MNKLENSFIKNSIELGGMGSEFRMNQKRSQLSREVPEGDAKFSKVLEKSLDQVNEFQVEADTAIKEFLAGRNKNIHETLLTIERADTSLKILMQVRNKVLDAYKEIMRMQI